MARAKIAYHWQVPYNCRSQRCTPTPRHMRSSEAQRCAVGNGEACQASKRYWHTMCEVTTTAARPDRWLSNEPLTIDFHQLVLLCLTDLACEPGRVKGLRHVAVVTLFGAQIHFADVFGPLGQHEGCLLELVDEISECDFAAAEPAQLLRYVIHHVTFVGGPEAALTAMGTDIVASFGVNGDGTPINATFDVFWLKTVDVTQTA